MLEAAEHLRALGDAGSADFAVQKAQEEKGHDELALLDLAGLGLDAEQIVADMASPFAVELVNEFVEMARSWPYGVFGYAFALEAVAMTRTQEVIDEAQALAEADITRCLRTHSALGVDPDHVGDLIDFIVDLPPAPKRDVYKGVYVAGEIARRHHSKVK
jgi:hypothetical protein